MPESYSQRFDRIMGPRPVATSLLDEGPPTVRAARSSGRLKGLLTTTQMARQARQDALDTAWKTATFARQAAQEDLARQREDRMASQFGATQARLAASEEARNRHTALMESLTAKKAGREEEEYQRNVGERNRIEPIYKALLGESVPGVEVDPETLDTKLMVGGKIQSLPGRFVGPMLEKHFGFKYKAPSGEDKQGVAEMTVTVNSLAAESGYKLDPTTKAALVKVIAKNPALLDALPDELAARANWQKETDRTKKLTGLLDATDFTKLPKDTRPWYNPASLFTDKPAVMALKGFTDKNEPNIEPMDVDEAKKQGYGLIQKKPTGYYLNDEPVAPPKPLGSLLDRLQPAPAMAPAVEPTSKKPVGPPIERTLKGTRQKVRVQPMSDGTYITLE